MGLSICVLASGSAANCIYISSDTTRILVDAGLSGKETARRLEELNIKCDDIHAVCVTHEHDDHRNALKVLHERHQIALYANAGTVDALKRYPKLQQLQWHVFTTGEVFTVGDLALEPFSVPHDSFDPVGFRVSYGERRVGIVTDMGMATGLVREKLRGCHALIIESNHDVEMLRHSQRPWALKQRIMGRQGHLSNAQAGELVADVADAQLTHVFLVHLSEDCNRKEVATSTIKRSIHDAGHTGVEVLMTYSDRISEMVTL